MSTVICNEPYLFVVNLYTFIPLHSDKVLAVKNEQDEDEEENSISEEPIYDETEVNGKFKIVSQHWTEDLNDPDSDNYKKMTETITRGIEELLADEGLTDQADFNITIVSFK